MQRNLVITVLAAAVLSGGAAILLLRPTPPPPPPPTTWLTSLDIGGVDVVELAWPDGRVMEIAASDRVPGLWIMRSGESTWPVGAARVRGALRLLMDSAATPPASDLRAEGGVRVRVGRGVNQRTLRIAATGLAGQSVVECEEGDSRVSFLSRGGLAGVFEHASVMAWREENAFVPVDQAGASRVSVETGGMRTMLARQGGRWGVLSPVAGAGEAERVTALLGALGALRLRAAPGANPEGMGFDRAVFAATIEVDLRVGREGGEVDRRTLVQEMLVGDIADAAGKTRYARVVATMVDPATGQRQPAWTPTPGTIEVASLGAIVADPREYWARRATATAPADVASLRLGGREWALEKQASPAPEARDRDVIYTRTLDGWSRTQGGITQAASPTTSAGVGALIALLCDESASNVSPDPPAGLMPLAMVHLHGAGELTLEIVGVGRLEGAGGAMLVVRTGRLFRLYKGPAAARVLGFIGSETPPEG